MSILVTGSSGTIGTRLCKRLLAEGRSVIGIDLVHNKWQKVVDDCTIIGDLRSEEWMDRLPGDIDTIVHLAANARVYELVEHPDRARDNMLSTFNALEFARHRGIKRFLFASSRETYGNIDEEIFTENMVRVENCESPYTASKIAGEALVQSYTRCYSVDHIIFRFSNVYGMYDDSVRVVPRFFREAKAGSPLTVFGEGKFLDFTYIDDAIDGVVRAIDNFESSKNATYNIAVGQGTSILTLAQTMVQLLKSNSQINLEPPRTGEVIRYVADIAKARHAFGYDPKTSFDEGIARSVEWYSDHT